MNVPLTGADTKPPSKFHGAYHDQLRMQAKMRQAKAFGLFLEGRTVREIAETMGINYSTAWRYIRREVDACRVANAAKTEAVREQQANVLNRIANEAWRAWKRSGQVGDRRVRTTDRKGREGRTHEEVRESERGPGDPRYLEIVLKALAEVRALYGIGVEPVAGIGAGGPINITARWGGELANVLDTSADMPAAAGGVESGDTGDTADAETDEHVSEVPTRGT